MDIDQTFGPEIVTKLKTTIRQRLSARHVPSLILPIQEIPYTVNGKKVLSFRFNIFSPWYNIVCSIKVATLCNKPTIFLIG